MGDSDGTVGSRPSVEREGNVLVHVSRLSRRNDFRVKTFENFSIVGDKCGGKIVLDEKLDKNRERLIGARER